MVQYETRLTDLEAGAGGVYQTTVAPVPIKPSSSWIWKTIAAITFVVFCAAAAVFFTWHSMKSDQKDLPHFPTAEKQIHNTHSEQGRMLEQIAEGTKAAIHLHGARDSGSLKWVSGVDQSFEQGGLRLHNNMIYIPADGLYFVYSQVSYSLRCKPDEADEDNTSQNFLSHSIWRYTAAVDDWKPLQNSAHSACHSQDDGKTTYSTIYLGAVFKLNEGDKLKTSTTRVTGIEEDYAKTFFGVFAL